MLLAAAWGVVSMIRIYVFLQRRGRKVSFLLLRVRIFEYLGDYRRITRAEHGRPGPLYTHFVAAWLIALASAISAGTILMHAR
jgi:hypothetical protein